MPNFWTHIKTSFFVFPILILVWQYLLPLINNLVSIRINNPLSYIFGFAFFVVGSDLPDIDHKDSIIHKVVRMFLMILMAGSSFYLLSGSEFVADFFSEYASTFKIPLYWLLSVLVGFISGQAFVRLKSKHRGGIHSSVAAIIYGVLVFIFVYSVMSFQAAIFPSISATIGYLLHLGLDKTF